MDKTLLLKALQSQYQGQMDIALANIECIFTTQLELENTLTLQLPSTLKSKTSHQPVKNTIQFPT